MPVTGLSLDETPQVVVYVRPETRERLTRSGKKGLVRAIQDI